jgi:hypothetical protein
VPCVRVPLPFGDAAAGALLLLGPSLPATADTGRLTTLPLLPNAPAAAAATYAPKSADALCPCATCRGWGGARSEGRCGCAPPPGPDRVENPRDLRQATTLAATSSSSTSMRSSTAPMPSALCRFALCACRGETMCGRTGGSMVTRRTCSHCGVAAARVLW